MLFSEMLVNSVEVLTFVSNEHEKQHILILRLANTIPYFITVR